MQEKKKLRKIILFVICLLFLALIIGFIVPAFLPYRPSPRIICIVNIRALGICCLVYHMDSKIWPTPSNWCDLLKPYSEEDARNPFLCPADEIGPCSYAMNENIPAEANDLPGDLVVLFESTPGWNRVGGADDVVTDRHDKKNPGANIAFADGRVEFVRAEDIPKLRWTIED
jgi:prepilin-type processing-associated H-X9-DG protein